MAMKLHPIPKVVGNSILVEIELDDDRAVKSDFLYIPKKEEYDKNVKMSAKVGKVIACGPDAFVRINASEPYCLPGDYVLFMQNAGNVFEHKESGTTYRVVKEGDIMLVIGEEVNE